MSHGSSNCNYLAFLLRERKEIASSEYSHESPVYLGLQSRPLSSYATLEFGTHTKKWSDILARLRPTRRLLASPEHGKGKAQVVDRPGQLAHILWAASRGDLGRRNVAVIWMLFGSGLRVNEVAHLKVSDIFYQDGTLKEVCVIPGNTTKTGKSRPAFVLARQHRDALVAWRDQRVTEGAFLSEDGSYGGLRDDSHLFLGRRGKHGGDWPSTTRSIRPVLVKWLPRKSVAPLRIWFVICLKALASTTAQVTLAGARWRPGLIVRDVILSLSSSFSGITVQI